jgi:C1A family cysteine protease
MMAKPQLGSMGWERDLPDFRDKHADSEHVAKILGQSRPLKAAKKKLPTSVDLSKWCSPVEDQGNLSSCTANAGVGLMEYYQRRAFGQHLDGSRLFLYKATRQLLGWKGDQGAYLRSAMKAMVLFGVAPESAWPYKPSEFDVEPPAFCFAYAQSYRAAHYYRLDPSGTTADALLKNVRTSLAAGLPSMFGFTVYGSIPAIGDGTGDIPFPNPGDKSEGGHAVVAIGYDDNKKIGAHRGALKIRNSWGVDWGEKGYGWLPYAYIEHEQADDFWSLVDAGFVSTGLFD